ncbi:carbamoyltransferase C-terminal domain-containing protein [Amycolatopsis tolypomycina]|uniref:carbamoyltransferase C-terminal domain-containing protein n=1 Tax=Amycolatopsis tolypomycina TaxID=208445 RepID=UPI0033A2A3B9
MLIFSFKEGHDGSIAAIDDGKLLFSLEAEKDSFPRYAGITAETVTAAAGRLDRLPDVIAIGGWVKGTHSVERPSRTGYFGVGDGAVSDEAGRFFGRDVRVFSSTHERSHIMTAYGMAPFANRQPAYCLVWEGNIGDFYRIDENGAVEHLRHVLADPGNKYAWLFALADPKFPVSKGLLRLQDAGKQMALTGFADKGPLTMAEKEVIDFILAQEGIILQLSKEDMKWSEFHDVGVESQAYKNVAAKLSDAIFDRFHDYAREHLTEGLPLLISGGCGLNCEWNRRWRECGLFPEVFVPPCPNDSGSALGTAIDAQLHHTGSAKVEWDAYAGEEFVHDAEFDSRRYETVPLDYGEVANHLADGNVIGWVQGRWEMGPRALGNRSILAAPFSSEMTTRLNKIKQREGYRPIAPICLESDAHRWFEGSIPDPYMLYFSRVTTEELAAVTHVDGTARAQTVTPEQNPRIARLLEAFRERTGFSVLCNTSLNFSGRGFINRTSDLIEYGERHGLDGYVVGDTFARRRAV